jgi:acetoin utilization deacetylase AcuC-like enzyme
MVLHYEGRGIPLEDFGILIPANRDRGRLILEALLADDDIASCQSEWLVHPDGSAITRADVARVHSAEYVGRVFGDDAEAVITAAYELVDENGHYHRYDPSRAVRPLTELFDDSLRWMAGSFQVGKEALSRGFCFNLGGGAHHAHHDFGHGFCIFNDIVISLRKLQAEGYIRTAWVVDVDAHKGDGTAALTKGDSSIVTLSVHMAHGWPLSLPEHLPDGRLHPSHTPSDIDVPIAAGEESHYVPRLRAALEKLDRYPRPDIAYVIDGADPYERDRLPSTQVLRLTLEQMLARDETVYSFLSEREIPQAYLMAGGYGEDAWEPYPQFIGKVIRNRLGLPRGR